MSALKDIIDNKVDDKTIVREEPMVVNVGGHAVFCRCFTYRNHQKWLAALGSLLTGFHALFQNVEFPGNQESIDKSRRSMMFLLSNKRVYDAIMKMFRRTVLREPGNEYWRWRWRKFKREVTVQEIIDLFFYVYLYNYEAVKKNVSFLLGRMGFVRNQGTYISGSVENLGGTVSRWTKPQYQNSAFTKSGGPRLLTTAELKDRESRARRKAPLTREAWEGDGGNGGD